VTRSRVHHVPMLENVSACTRYARGYSADIERQHDLECALTQYHSFVASSLEVELERLIILLNQVFYSYHMTLILLISIIQFTFGKKTTLKHSKKTRSSVAKKIKNFSEVQAT